PSRQPGASRRAGAGPILPGPGADVLYCATGAEGPSRAAVGLDRLLAAGLDAARFRAPDDPHREERPDPAVPLSQGRREPPRIWRAGAGAGPEREHAGHARTRMGDPSGSGPPLDRIAGDG